jgi:hypothetical protein
MKTLHEQRLDEIEMMQDRLFPLSTKGTRQYVRDRASKAIDVFQSGTIQLDNDAIMMLISQICFEAGSSFLGEKILREYLDPDSDPISLRY